MYIYIYIYILLVSHFSIKEKKKYSKRKKTLSESYVLLNFLINVQHFDE